MPSLSSHLDPIRLLRLLTAKTPAEDEWEVEGHLESCEVCRHELESLAAEPAWWTDASTLFRGESLSDSARGLEASLRSPLRGASVEPITNSDVREFLEPSDSPAMLGRLGPYEILEVLGRGGFGVVLKGYDQELNRWVAIKVLAPHYAGGAARERFAREARAAAAVVHPHVISIHAVDGQSRLQYLVMPFVAGESLQQRLDREGPLPLEAILRIGQQVAEGLAAAHAQGLVHRDVKPANILLEKGVDRVVLTDFGLAQAADDATLTCSGIVAGTPQYMSPEQAHGDKVDLRSDLFSLGSVLYAMCTGCPPFRAANPIAILRRISDDEPRPPHHLNTRIPSWLGTIIAQLHAKTPDQRPANAAVVADVLQQCLAHVQNPAAVVLPRSLRCRWSPFSKVKIAPRSLAALVMLAVFGGILLVVGHQIRNRAHPLWTPPAPPRQAVRASPPSPVSPTVRAAEVTGWNSDGVNSLAEVEQTLERLEKEIPRDDSW